MINKRNEHIKNMQAYGDAHTGWASAHNYDCFGFKDERDGGMRGQSDVEQMGKTS